jgi:hypothetical protein
MDLGNPPGYLGLDRNYFAGDEFANGVKIVGDVLRDCWSNSYRRRRPLKGRRRLFLATREEGQAAKNDSAEKLSCKKFCSKLIAVECAIIVHCDRFAFEIA